MKYEQHKGDGKIVARSFDFGKVYISLSHKSLFIRIGKFPKTWMKFFKWK